jgi:hypothetical protein
MLAIMPDNHAENADRQFELDELVARIGTIYTKKGFFSIEVEKLSVVA